MTELERLAKKYTNINLPTICPLCSSKLVINETWSRISCPNLDCYTYAHSRIVKYLEKMGIMHISGAIIDRFLEESIITDIPDLYNIDWNEVATLEGFGKTSTNKFKKEIDSHRDCTIPQFLAGFNISGMGEIQIEKMIQEMSLDEILSITDYHDFMTVGIKDLTAKKFLQGLNNLKYLIKETSKYVNFIEYDNEEDELVSDLLNGLSFCFTGKIENYTRVQLENIVRENGGIVANVTKNLSYLVTDELNSTSSKMINAKKLGIEIISSKQFLEMLK